MQSPSLLCAGAVSLGRSHLFGPLPQATLTHRFHFTALWFPNQHQQHPFLFSQKRTNTSDCCKSQLALTECCSHSPGRGGASQPHSRHSCSPDLKSPTTVGAHRAAVQSGFV